MFVFDVRCGAVRYVLAMQPDCAMGILASKLRSSFSDGISNRHSLPLPYVSVATKK